MRLAERMTTTNFTSPCSSSSPFPLPMYIYIQVPRPQEKGCRRKMVMAARQVILCLGITFLLVASASAHISVSFGYCGAIGPDKWGSLRADYELCAKGKRQSPIDIVKEAAVLNPDLAPLRRFYAATNGTLVDYGFNIALRYNDNVGYVTVEGKNYTLIQMHWHSPSEHTINGERFPVELHLVHKSEDGNISVVAILYKLGRPDALLVQLKDKVAKLAKEAWSSDKEAQVPVGRVQTKAIRRHSRKYYRYVGSLTVPPCTENVIWSILSKERTLSWEQVIELQSPLDKAYRNNSRPTQPLNGRVVQLYDELKSN